MANEMPFSWKEVKKFSDLVPDSERKIIKEYHENAAKEGKSPCKDLKYEDDCYGYCSFNLIVTDSDRRPSHGSSIYRNHLGMGEQHLCIFNPGSCYKKKSVMTLLTGE